MNREFCVCIVWNHFLCNHGDTIIEDKEFLRVSIFEGIKNF
jgi:hypothetical protein